MNRRHTWMIASYTARNSVRGGIGLVFLLLSLTFGLLVAHFMLQPVEMMAKQSAEYKRRDTDAERAETTAKVLDQMTDQAKPVVTWMLSTKKATEPPAEPKAGGRNRSRNAPVLDDPDAEAWADYLLDSRPAMLSAIFLILLLGWPFVVGFGAFDLYAGDIASRQLRYQLLRVDRSSIYFGRLLGLLLTFVFVLALLGITVTLYMGLKLNAYPWGDMLGWAGYGTVMMVVVSLPYIALCAWISAAVGGSFTSLTIGSLVIGGVPLLATLGKMTHEAAGYVNYLLPWAYQTRLLHHEPLQVALAVGGCLLQTALFVWLGHRTFTRRDL